MSLCCHLCFFLMLCEVECDRILIVVGHISPASHKKSVVPFAEELGKQGNDVHFWNIEYTYKPIKSQHFKDGGLLIDSDRQWVLDIMKYGNSTQSLKMFWMSDKTSPLDFIMPWFFSMLPCDTAIHQHFDDLKKLAADNWDFIMFESIFTPCSWILRKLTPPTTKIMSVSSSAFMSHTTAARAHGSHIVANPDVFTPMSYDHFRFIDRVTQLYTYVQTHTIYPFLLQLTALNQIGQTHWGFSPAKEQASAGFAFATYPEMLGPTAPRNRDARSFGGGIGSCDQSLNQLDEEYKSFVDDPSSKGTIIAAFGHHTSWQYAPETLINCFVHTFQKLKDYRIIWQYSGGPQLPKMPNVKIVTWFPQKELLAHPNTKVFISHMGLKSMVEAVCAALPVMACPIFAEQPRNSANLVDRGMAIAVDKKRVQPQEFHKALVTLLTDNKYQKNAKKWSVYLKNGYILNPASESAFWLRFSKKPQDILNNYLYNKGKDMGYISYFCIDVLFTVICVVGSVFYVLLKLVSCLVKS